MLYAHILQVIDIKEKGIKFLRMQQTLHCVPCYTSVTSQELVLDICYQVSCPFVHQCSCVSCLQFCDVDIYCVCVGQTVKMFLLRG